MRLYLVNCLAAIGLAQSPVAEPKPDFAPSREVHISPSTMKEDSTSVTSRPDYWIARGFGLKEMIARLYKVEERRVILPAGFDAGKRYDFALVLPKPEEDAAIDGLVEHAIQTHFGLAMGREKRMMDVYVMTAPRGLSSAVRTLPDSGSKSISSGVTVTTTSISADNATVQDIRQMLEQHFHTIVLDDTGLAGRYEFDVKGIDRTDEAFLSVLREKLGLDLTRGRRDVDMVVVTKSR